MKRREIAEFLLLAGVWGGSFLFMRVAAPVLGAVWLIELRVLIAGLALMPLVMRSGLLPELRDHWLTLFIAGCINSALPFSLLAFASIALPAGFTSILNATTPLFGSLVAWIWLKEKTTLPRILGCVVGFVGVLVLMGWQRFSPTPQFGWAVAAGLLASCLYGVGAPFIKHKLAGISALAVTTGSQLGAACFLLPLLPFTLPDAPLSLSVVVSVLGLALLSTAFAYMLYLRLIRSIGSTKTLTVTYWIPFFAMLWGSLFLDESINLSMIVGCGLILLGTAIANDVLAGRHRPLLRGRHASRAEKTVGS
ncbi:MAG: DMT family transporter [Cyanobacteriota bacterium]|nr:DMT family transporter [Cyanobacteriota bacterium]